MNKILIITAFTCFLTIAASAQKQWPEGYAYKKLHNGLEVITIVNRQLPMVTVELALKNGAITEGPEYTGPSHLYEHMFFKANKNFPTNKQMIAFEEKNQTNANTANQPALFELFGGGWRNVPDYYVNIKKQKLADVNIIFRNYFKNITWVYQGKMADADKSLFLKN